MVASASTASETTGGFKQVDLGDVSTFGLACGPLKPVVMPLPVGDSSALVGLLGNGIGFFVAPLVVWLIKREDDPYIDEQGKEAVNFQLTMMLSFFAAALLIFVVVGIVLLPLLGIFDVVMTIVAGLKAANGEAFRYPFAIRFVK